LHLDLPNCTLQSGPCCLCRATMRGDNSWADFRNNAAWLDCCWTPTEWLNWPNRSSNVLFQLAGVTAVSIALDYMRCKYLGSDMYQFGSALYMLCYFVLTGAPLENVHTCWAFIKGFYKTHNTGSRYRYLNKLTMFCRRSGYPKLRGKANEIRHFWSRSFGIVGCTHEWCAGAAQKKHI
jgi:hypothetical protein